MNTFLKAALFLLSIIVMLFIIALAGRMHIFLAIPVIIITVFAFSLLSVWMDIG